MGDQAKHLTRHSFECSFPDVRVNTRQTKLKKETVATLYIYLTFYNWSPYFIGNVRCRKASGSPLFMIESSNWSLAAWPSSQGVHLFTVSVRSEGKLRFACPWDLSRVIIIIGGTVHRRGFYFLFSQLWSNADTTCRRVGSQWSPADLHCRQRHKWRSLEGVKAFAWL